MKTIMSRAVSAMRRCHFLYYLSSVGSLGQLIPRFFFGERWVCEGVRGTITVKGARKRLLQRPREHKLQNDPFTISRSVL